MKQIWGKRRTDLKKAAAFWVAVTLTAVILLPFLVLKLSGGLGSNPLKLSQGNVPIKVYFADQNQTETLNLEEYIVGVVAAEMPAEFNSEALKAQAVAARTFAVKQMVRFGGPGLPDKKADVSTDYHVSQAYWTLEQRQEKWGAKAAEYNKKIQQAVIDTAGVIMTYQSQPILAAFHSTSGLRTASAKEVWGQDVPYLVSVPTEWDQQSPRYEEQKAFTFQEISQKLGSEAASVSTASQDGKLPVQVLSTTESGRVEKIRLGSKVFSGQEVRDKLGLRSTAFTVQMQSDQLLFHTLGYGHGVGMGQYGANGLAQQGRLYDEILKYYYQGIEFKNIYGI